MIDLTGLTFDDVLLRPQKGILKTRKDADISTRLDYHNLQVPFVLAPMPAVSDWITCYQMTEQGGASVVHRFQTTEEQIEIYRKAKEYAEYFGVENPAIFCAVGLDDRWKKLYDSGVRNFCLDVAHGHSEAVCHFLKDEASLDATWMVGNIATKEGAMDLVDWGADIIKVGVGPGSVCTTREVTGHGVPQLQAIAEARLGAPDSYIVADGGIKNSGDIVKALAVGADAVMMGRMFAHTIHAPGAGEYYGCASATLNGHRAPEGAHITVTEERESMEDIVKRLAWGLRSGISYSGARNIDELQAFADFQVVSAGTGVESAVRL